MNTGNRNRTILIASSRLDEPTWGPVATILKRRNFNVVIYEGDQVAEGKIPFEIVFEETEGIRVAYRGCPLKADRVAAAWKRRPDQFKPNTPDVARQMTVDRERRKIQALLWELVPTQAWLNDPKCMASADDKLIQLAVASEVGFSVPKTVVSNQWATVNTELPKDIILKMAYGYLPTTDNIYMLYTKRLENDPDKLPIDTNPFPGYWQPYLNKKREWRVTVVGEKVFSATIYTHEEAKDDWRRLQHDSKKITFKEEKLPKKVRQKCLEYLCKFGLRFGAFDFVEDNSGKITFLECNPNGQYGWLEKDLGMPISEALASELERIAIANTSS